MANVLFTRKNASEIPNVPITDGQLIFDTSGNGKMYLDDGTDRLEMGGAVTVDASLSKTSTNAIQNKAVTGNILNSLAEVSAATQQNTIAGALALKEVNSSLGGCEFSVESDGAYVTYTVGADTVTKKLGETEIKVVSKTTNYPMAGINSEQTVTFSVEFDAIEGYQLAYAGITQMNTFISNGTIKYVEFTNMQITDNTVSWSVHTKRGTGYGTASVVIQAVFIPV